jgi:hypothetical protein
MSRFRPRRQSATTRSRGAWRYWPSAVPPGEYDLVINSRHSDWQRKWAISGPVTFAFDATVSQVPASK